jgi:hypothetical protein
VAPYVPFSTFETGLNKLAALGGIPPKIDHTVFQQMGGVQKGQVISAFKFLGLIDADGVPDAALSDLALNRDGRKEALRKIVKARYPNITEQDLATMSPGQLDTKLADKSYNVSGATRQKARSFLLKAAEFAGIPLSKLLTAKGPRGPRKTGSRKQVLSDKSIPLSSLIKKDASANNNSGGDSRTVQLASGGSVTLLLDVSLLSLKGPDREFVFSLIDKLDAFENKES